MFENRLVLQQKHGMRLFGQGPLRRQSSNNSRKCEIQGKIYRVPLAQKKGANERADKTDLKGPGYSVELPAFH
jgi:hypothetical protein